LYKGGGQIKYPAIIVTGITKNFDRRSKKQVSKLNDYLGKFFDHINFYLIESDSTDRKLFYLNQTKQELENFQYKSLGILSQEIPNRIERLRHCRNQYIKYIRSNNSELNSPFVLVVDFDIRNNRLNFKPLIKFINDPHRNWSAVFCNQTGRYYDIYALRADNWSENDCFLEAKKISIEKGWKIARQEAIWSKMIHISKKQKGAIAVHSAFGGMGLYKNEVFLNFDYNLDLNDSPIESEHVALHKKIEAKGGKLFILPGFTNFSWNPHNLSSFSFFRYLDTISKKAFLEKFRRKTRFFLN
jgi:hypothetical protein